jgi:hypothetical protein
MHALFRRLSIRKPFELGGRTDIQSNHSVSMRYASSGAAFIAALPGRGMAIGLVFA